MLTSEYVRALWHQPSRCFDLSLIGLAWPLESAPQAPSITNLVGSTEIGTLIRIALTKPCEPALRHPRSRRSLAFLRASFYNTNSDFRLSFVPLLENFHKRLRFLRYTISDSLNHEIAAISKHKLVAQFATSVAQHNFESLRSPTQSDFTLGLELRKQIMIA